MTSCTCLMAGRDFPKGSSLRDSELENTLHMFAEPLFKAAGLDPKKLHLYLIVDPDLNAAATTRYTILLNTGLLIRAKNAEEVIGVLAHETGHIAGGHIARREEMMRKSTKLAMASILLGVATAAISGRADAGFGISLAGSQMAEDTFLHYSRGQESSADHAAVRFLSQLHWPANGLLSFMEILANQDLLSTSMQDAYGRTHPLSQNRVDFLRNYVEKTVSLPSSLPPHFQKAFERMKTKLEAFLSPPLKILTQYTSSDTTEMAYLARAIALFRHNQLGEALQAMDNLLKIAPQDPYYLDLKGQMLFESGRLQEAATAYQQALQQRPQDALIHMSLAHTLIELKQTDSDAQAEKSLKIAQRHEKENPFIWRLFARIYGRQGKQGLTFLCLAEESLALGDFETALKQTERALKLLKEKARRLRAEDIRQTAQQELDTVS